ncbi:T9SS type A sorting domain-containing protein [candidate division KSB1 bacterium]|nr:T9SS type A sorting domain-containing protein [candidate division KSB1 bacterium]
MRKVLLLLATVVFLFNSVSIAASFWEERRYEPVVITGGILKDFFGVPINEIYMYAFDETTGKLKLIPFQIDEKILTVFEIDLDPDPVKKYMKSFERHYYANSGTGIVDDNKFDVDDELVFIVGDLGNLAPGEAWDDVPYIQRRTIFVSDPDNPQRFVAGYLVHSTEKKTVPSFYNFAYDAQNDVVKNSTYSIKMARPSGLIQDISFFSPFGNGVDIFDTQKIRVVGRIDLGLIQIQPGKNNLPALNDRDNFFIYPKENYLSATETPRVRLVREAHQTIRTGDVLFSLLGVSFFVTTKFYPFSGTLEGGASLDYETLREMFEDPDDIYLQFELVRQSWDFNQNAKNMKFYNPQNNGILVDGVADNNVNKTLNSTNNIREWTMLSGEQGTMFSYLKINDDTFEKIQLYYHDNQNGGQDDDSYIPEGDTGDNKSFGDNGLKIINSQSLDLGFTAYFVGKNKDKAFAEQLAHNIENPVNFEVLYVGVKEKKESIQPDGFELSQNYPNPFNNATEIAFALPATMDVQIKMYDLQGHLVNTLMHDKMPAGRHHVKWDGRDELGHDVPSGVYIYKMVTDQFQDSKKLLLVK